MVKPSVINVNWDPGVTTFPRKNYKWVKIKELKNEIINILQEIKK